MSNRRLLGPETAKNDSHRSLSGFYAQFMSGKGVDIGYRGATKGAQPVLPTARGIEKEDLVNGSLPSDVVDVDYVFSSHCLEHISDYKAALQDWLARIKPGGHLVLAVPHQWLYERKASLPSRWNDDHKRFYTPASLLREVEEALAGPSPWLSRPYRVRLLEDNDRFWDATLPADQHASGCYEIVLVLQKL